MDTIFALSSGAGRAGVAVIRVSGPLSRNIASGLGCKNLQPRRACVRKLRHPRTGEILDQAVVLSFPSPHSFTGDDTLELHVHGGRAVVRSVQQAVAELGARPADPGEFTRRAFSNGRIDLTEVEGISDLIDADTEAQRRQALELARGGLSNVAGKWRQTLIELLALVEADVDFVDEEDAPTLDATLIVEKTRLLLADVHRVLSAAQRGRKTREGFQVVIAGAPNAGKSTLLNALAGRDVAIVSEIAGTTRDALEVPLEIGGHSVTLIDTAGFRPTDDVIERMGVERTGERVRAADLVVWLRSRDADLAPFDVDSTLLEVWTKSDRYLETAGTLAVSALTGEGLQDLIAKIGEKLELTLEGSEPPLLTRERHVYLIEEVRNELERIEECQPAEIMAEHLRLAARALSRLAGTIDVEDVLGEIFSRFCIGK